MGLIEIPLNTPFHAEVGAVHMDDGIVSLINVEIPSILENLQVLNRQICHYCTKVERTAFYPAIDQYFLLFLSKHFHIFNPN